MIFSVTVSFATIDIIGNDNIFRIWFYIFLLAGFIF